MGREGDKTEGGRQQGRLAMGNIVHWKIFPEKAGMGPRRVHRGQQVRLNQAKEGGPVLGGSGEAMPGAKPSEGRATGAGSAAASMAGSTGAAGVTGATASAPHGQCCWPSAA